MRLAWRAGTERMQVTRRLATDSACRVREAKRAGGKSMLRGVAARGALTLTLCFALAGGVLAQQSAVEASAPAADAVPLKPSPEFANFPRYEGTLGKRRIVLRLGAKTDDPSGVHGEYQYADTGVVVLIAGDRDGDTLEVEESNDGTHITGNWVGRFAADGSLAGDRMNVDDSDPQPFSLHPLSRHSSTDPS
jgi:hypothetical protein